MNGLQSKRQPYWLNPFYNDWVHSTTTESLFQRLKPCINDWINQIGNAGGFFLFFFRVSGWSVVDEGFLSSPREDEMECVFVRGERITTGRRCDGSCCLFPVVNVPFIVASLFFSELWKKCGRGSWGGKEEAGIAQRDEDGIGCNDCALFYGCFR